MALKILCCGYLVRHPVGGHTWHHLQYLVGLRRLGHRVVFLEHFGWPNSCYDPDLDAMGPDPSAGIRYLKAVFDRYAPEQEWCFLAEDGVAHGMTHEELDGFCDESDLCLSLSNMNWTPHMRRCRRLAMVDTDPVFTQTGTHGAHTNFADFDLLFSFGENVHRSGCEMPTGGASWIATRQPVVLDLWPVTRGNPLGPYTSVMNWSAYGDRVVNGRLYGQKDREFDSYIRLPNLTALPMELVVNAPPSVRERLLEGGWQLAAPVKANSNPQAYQQFLQRSRGEFSVAKHGYVTTQCGWFSDRSTAYLALGRPVVIQDTGFSRHLPIGQGILSFSNFDEAKARLREVERDYSDHCRAARQLIAEYFDSSDVLARVLSYCV